MERYSRRKTGTEPFAETIAKLQTLFQKLLSRQSVLPDLNNRYLQAEIKRRLIDMGLAVEHDKLKPSNRYLLGIANTNFFKDTVPDEMIKDFSLESTIIHLKEPLHLGVDSLLQIGITRFSRKALVAVGIQLEGEINFQPLKPACVLEMDWTKNGKPARTLILGLVGVKANCFRIGISDLQSQQFVFKDVVPDRFTQEDLLEPHS